MNLTNFLLASPCRYNAVRCAKYRRAILTLAGMNQGADDIAERLTYDHPIEGYLEKTGPKTTEAWRKRYCRLARRRLMYSEKQLDAFCKGEIALGERSEGFAAVEGLPDNCRKSHSSGVPFTLQTPYRSFLFLCPTDDNRRRWVTLLNRVIDTPMTLQQRNELATTTRKKSGRIF